MNKDYHSINYSFQVQSVEDFYNQLREFHLKSLYNEEQVDISDTTLAKSMLRKIGVEY
jgi:hypothetical protein